MDWILSPIAQYGFLALALIGCLALFLSMKSEISQLRRALDESAESAKAANAAIAATDAALTTLATDVAALHREMESAATTFASGQELNLTRRAHALRMQHRGESSTTIAAALRVPRNEIELLLRVQEIANPGGQPPASSLQA